MERNLQDLRVLCVRGEGRQPDQTAEGLGKRVGVVALEADASEAEEKIESGDFGCVVADAEATRANDYELLRACESNSVPLVLFTGEEDVVVEALSLGVSDYVLKVGDREVRYASLAKTVENVVRLNRAEGQLRGSGDGSEFRNELTFLERTLDTLDELFYVIGTDGNLVRWNETLSSVTGYVDAEISRMDAVDFFPEEEREKISDAVERVIEKGMATVESSVLTKRGDTIHHEFTGARLTNHEGEVIGLAGIGRDITHRKEREQELKESKRKLQAVLDSVDAAIWIRDTKSRFSLVNQAFCDLFEIDDETEVVGKRPEELLPEEVASQFRENDRKTIENGHRTEIEEKVRTPHGTRTYLTRITPLFDERDRVYGTCGIASDITELKEYEERLERQKENLDEFASLVSHDLRNPLSIFQGYLEKAEETGDTEDFAKCREAVDRMDALIDDLLSLSRNASGTEGVKTLSLTEVAERTWRETRTPNAELRLGEDATVVADEGQMRQLLKNLFRNSVEHGPTSDEQRDHHETVRQTPKAGATQSDATEDSVTVKVTGIHEGNGFRVEDDGKGIPDDERDRVFEPGHSGDEDGTGLGLRVVKQVVDAHGWDVTVTESEEGGAAFEITCVGSTGRRNAGA